MCSILAPLKDVRGKLRRPAPEAIVHLIGVLTIGYLVWAGEWFLLVPACFGNAYVRSGAQHGRGGQADQSGTGKPIQNRIEKRRAVGKTARRSILKRIWVHHRF
jgi:hypothetical protein